jgi:hypothetical protein
MTSLRSHFHAGSHYNPANCHKSRIRHDNRVDFLTRTIPRRKATPSKIFESQQIVETRIGNHIEFRLQSCEDNSVVSVSVERVDQWAGKGQAVNDER